MTKYLILMLIVGSCSSPLPPSRIFSCASCDPQKAIEETCPAGGHIIALEVVDGRIYMQCDKLQEVKK